MLRRPDFTSKTIGFYQNYRPILFSVYVSSNSFINISKPFISIAVLIFFQRSVLRGWEKLSSFQLFPSFPRLQVFSTLSLSSLTRKQHLGSGGGGGFLSWSSRIRCDSWQYRASEMNGTSWNCNITRLNVTISRSSINMQTRSLVSVNNSYIFRGYSQIENSIRNVDPMSRFWSPLPPSLPLSPSYLQSVS